MERSVGTSASTIIARYIPFPIPGQTNFITNMPNWLIEASGGVASGTFPQNNKATIKMTAIAKDAQCATDAGIYRCNATYLTQDVSVKVDRFQNVTGKATPENHLITLDQHNGNNPQISRNENGQNVSLTCSVRCPYGSALSWLYGPPNGNFNPYPITNDIQMVTPSPPNVPLLCGKYDYELVLTLSVQYGETMYICVVKDDKGVVSSQMNFTIEGTSTQQLPMPIVDKTVIADGETFTITCDINRFASNDIPSSAPFISDLSLERTVGKSPRTIIVSYVPLVPAGFANLTTNIPPGRNWVIEATGGVSTGAISTNNKNTIKITVVVKDATCADAGIYRCNATYVYQSQTTVPGKVDRFKIITAKGFILLSWLPGHHVGSNFSPYPFTNAIQVITPSPPTSPRTQYNFASTLNTTLQLGETMYICVVTGAGVEVIRKNFTIDGQPDKANVEIKIA